MMSSDFSTNDNNPLDYLDSKVRSLSLSVFFSELYMGRSIADDPMLAHDWTISSNPSPG
jgi:hypothetical protein